MESKLDKDFAFLAVAIIIIMIGTFARFIIDSHLLSMVCWVLIAIGTVMSLMAIARVLAPYQEENK